MDWLGLLAVQGTLKSRLQHHSSKASILRRLAFFTVQLSHPYMTTGKTTPLTRRAFVGKVISAFSYAVQVCHSFPSKEQVSLNFTAAVTICSDSGAQENKICHYFHFSPSICHEVTGLDAIILFFPMLSFKPASPLSPFTLIKRLFTSSSLSAIRVVSSAYLKL